MSPTVPGDIPGLLRRGSPVQLTVARFHGVVLDDPEDASYAAVCWRSGDYGARRTTDYDRCHLVLDLSDATGRVHAAWWLLRQFGRSASFPNYDLSTRITGEIGSAQVSLSEVAHCWCAETAYPKAWTWVYHENVPTLADLDPNDQRRLPDGSSLVAAEALRRVVLHVAGRPL